MIEAVGLRKVYPDGTVALRDVDLQVEQGEFVFLVGRSGAGKTTLFKLIIGMEKPSGGRLLVDGVDLGSADPAEIRRLRRTVGMIFQDFRLIKGRIAADNVALGLRMLGLSAAGIRRRASAALADVGLAEKAGTRVEALSWGEQQRVAIARALARDPVLILADEPTGNLDQAMAALVMERLLAANRKGATVVVASHARALVERSGRRVLTLRDGAVLRERANVMTAPASGGCADPGAR